MLSLRVANAGSALAAIAGLAGLSLLPLEHVHFHRDDGSTHHPAIVHRHAAGHHASEGQAVAPVGGRATLHIDDDDDGPLIIQLFFKAGERVAPHQPRWAADYLNAVLPNPPEGRRIELFSWTPPPHGPPFDPARPLRAPPAAS